jgi:hypothetical protein
VPSFLDIVDLFIVYRYESSKFLFLHIFNGLTITDVFLNPKRINVCEHMVKMASCRFTYIYSLVIEKNICDC